MALTTARISSARGRPPDLGGGIKSLIQSHSASVRSVGYGVAVIPPVYRTGATYGRLFKQPLRDVGFVGVCSHATLLDLLHDLLCGLVAGDIVDNDVSPSARATPRPMPELAPVISAFWPRNTCWTVHVGLTTSGRPL